jgi:hypothetical protein
MKLASQLPKLLTFNTIAFDTSPPKLLKAVKQVLIEIYIKNAPLLAEDGNKVKNHINPNKCNTIIIQVQPCTINHSKLFQNVGL